MRVHRSAIGIQWTLGPSPRRVFHLNLSENATVSLGLNSENSSLHRKLPVKEQERKSSKTFVLLLRSQPKETPVDLRSSSGRHRAQNEGLLWAKRDV